MEILTKKLGKPQKQTRKVQIQKKFQSENPYKNEEKSNKSLKIPKSRTQFSSILNRYDFLKRLAFRFIRLDCSEQYVIQKPCCHSKKVINELPQSESQRSASSKRAVVYYFCKILLFKFWCKQPKMMDIFKSNFLLSK